MLECLAIVWTKFLLIMLGTYQEWDQSEMLWKFVRTEERSGVICGHVILVIILHKMLWADKGFSSVLKWKEDAHNSKTMKLIKYNYVLSNTHKFQWTLKIKEILTNYLFSIISGNTISSLLLHSLWRSYDLEILNSVKVISVFLKKTTM